MNSLFRRIVAAILVTVLVMVAILTVGLLSGYNRSMRAWSTEREGSVREIARTILQARRDGDPEQAERISLPPDIPVFVYDEDRQLILSNRGVGRRRELEGFPILPVRGETGSLLGYYSVGATQFQTDAANRALMNALVRTVVTAFLAAVTLAALSALVLARHLSRPAAEVARGIDRMAAGELMVRVPEAGVREVAGIARSANLLALRLEREQGIRAQWVQDVAHDLRSPVAMIKAQLEAIADGVYHADPDRLRKLLTELARMEQLIGDLDELMRLEAPELQPEMRAFSVEAFLGSLKDRFADSLAQRPMELLVDNSWEHATIAGDENLLYRAVSNILSNAIRYGGDSSGGTIRCTLAPIQGGHAVRITVWNDGTPVPPEDLPRVFDRLYRGEYARNTTGCGLGLTIARRIVQLHEGSIRMDSSADGGTTVTIDLPQAH